MLNVQGITFHRGQVPILEHLAFRVESGEALLIRGHNGSGKTTLLKLLAGLLPPQERFEATLDGAPYRPQEPETQRQLAYLGHTLGIKDDLSCLENLEFLARFLGQRDDRSPQGVLRAVGLDGYQYTHARRLSAGQRKRLALARLLLCPARLWFLDEPYSNLDGDGITLVDRLLDQHVREGGAALLTSHGTFVPQIEHWRELVLDAPPEAAA